jgi:hypothetical protein
MVLEAGKLKNMELVQACCCFIPWQEAEPQASTRGTLLYTNPAALTVTNLLLPQPEFTFEEFFFQCWDLNSGPCV